MWSGVPTGFRFDPSAEFVDEPSSAAGGTVGDGAEPSASAHGHEPLADTSGSSNTGKKKLKAPRTSLACDVCRKTKVRCEGGSEKDGIACNRCSAMGIECLYNDKPQKKQPPSRAYVEALEKRLEAMEAALNSMSGSPASNEASAQPTDQRDHRPANLSQSSTAQGPYYVCNPVNSGDSSERESSLDHLDAITDRVDELNLVEDRYMGRSSAISIAQMILNNSSASAAAKNQQPEMVMSVVEAVLHDEHTARGRLSPVPPPDLAEKLVEGFFRNINEKTFPLLHRPSFERGVRSKLFEVNLSFRALYLGVCAIGARFVEDSRLQPPAHPMFNRGALKYALGWEYMQGSLMNVSVPFANGSLFDIQALLLIAMFMLGSGSGMSAWTIVGYALRRTIDVGMHRENRPRWRISPLENELRKRVFCMLIFFDQFLSSQLGRPESVQDSHYDLKEPRVIDDDTLDQWDMERTPEPPAKGEQRSLEADVLRGFLALVSLSRISGDAMRQLYLRPIHEAALANQTVSGLDVRLNEWLEKVPEYLRWKPATMDLKWLAMSFNLYTAYYDCQLFIHRDFISPRRAALTKYPALAICANAARSLVQLLDEMRKRNLLSQVVAIGGNAAATAILMLMFNGLVQIQQSNQLSQSAAQDVRKCLDVLETLSATVFFARSMHRTMVPLCDALMVNSLSKKRSHLEASSSSSAAETPSSTHSSPPGVANADDVDGPDERKSNKTRKLPLTTNDLSLPTFRGRPTFLPAPAPLDGPGPPQQTPSSSTSSSFATGIGLTEPEVSMAGIQSLLSSLSGDPASFQPSSAPSSSAVAANQPGSVGWPDLMSLADRTPGSQFAALSNGNFDWSLPPLSPTRGVDSTLTPSSLPTTQPGTSQSSAPMFSPFNWPTAMATMDRPTSAYPFPSSQPMSASPDSTLTVRFDQQHHQASPQQPQQHQHQASAPMSDMQDFDFNAILGTFAQGMSSWR